MEPYPLHVKRVIVPQVANALIENPMSHHDLKTKAHVKWALQVLSQGFLLNLEDEQVIWNCLEIFRKWLLDSEKPQPIVENHEKFLERILRALGLAFAAKKYESKEQIEIHANICNKVLDIFLSVSRNHANKITTEIWELWMRLLVGVCDQLMQIQVDLGSILAPKMLRVTFEIWLVSHNRSPALWELFKTRIRKWNHLIIVMHQWNATCEGLTRRVLGLMYGPAEGTMELEIRIEDAKNVIPLKPEHVLYCWNKVLSLLGNLNDLLDPKIFALAIQGTVNLINLFLGVGKQKNSDPKLVAPDANTILHIFGHWLFEAIKLRRTSFEDGVAICVESLYNIFRQKSHSKFLPIYLGSFYNCLADVLQRPDCKPLTSLFSCCGGYLLEEWEGSRVITPSLLCGISEILTNSGKNDKIRENCIGLLTSLVGFPKHFGTTQFLAKLPEPASKKLITQLASERINNQPTLPEIGMYQDLTNYLGLILLKALRVENNPENSERLIWSCAAYATEYNSFAFLKSFVDLIITKVSSSIWSSSLTMSALYVLEALAENWTNQRDLPLFDNVLTSMAAYCFSHTQLDNFHKDDENLVCKGYEVLRIWLSKDQQWSLAPNQVSTLLRCCVSGMNVKKNYNRCRDCAQQLLFTVCSSGIFPFENGARTLSSLMDEKEILDMFAKKGIKNPEQYVRYYAYKQTIIFTVIEDPLPNTGPGCYLVIRNKTGKFVWRTSLVFYPLNEDNKQPVKPVPSVVKSPPEAFAVPPEKDFDELLIYAKRYQRGDNIIDLALTQATKEKEKLKQRNYQLDVKSTIERQVTPKAELYNASLSKNHMGKLFLTAFGLLTLENKSHFMPLKNVSEVEKLINRLDKEHARFCQSVSVVYVGQGHTSLDEVFNNKTVSREFQDFCHGLGWGINPNEHRGYLGPSEKMNQFGNTPNNKVSNRAAYYADVARETVFHIHHLQNHDLSGQNNVQAWRKKLLEIDEVAIIWTENPNFDQVQPMFANAVQIMISPQPHGLCRISTSIKAPEVRSIFSPLQKGTLVRKEHLPYFARITAINATEQVKFGTSGPTLPYFGRNKVVEQLAQLGQHENVAAHFSSMFLPPKN